MGPVCGCLRHTGRSPINSYQSGTAKNHDACVCGKPFDQPKSNFCSFCGEPLKAAVLVERRDSFISDASNFSDIVPGGIGDTSTHSVSSTGSVGWGSDDASESEACAKSRHSNCSSKSSTRCPSACSGSTRESVSSRSEKHGEVGSRNGSLLASGGPVVTSENTPPPRPKKQALEPQPTSPRGTPTQRHPPSASQDFLSALSQALKHSGCLVTKSMPMLVLKVPDKLAYAYKASVQPDVKMPTFEAKVDMDNLLTSLPKSSLKPQLLSLQRVCFMNTDWLGLRLESSSPNPCRLFCLCVTALQNFGKNTSRSVVVVSAEEEAEQFVFACVPTYSHSKKAKGSSPFVEPFIDHAEDIGELASIILNEAGSPQKKVTADLKRWCGRHQRLLSEEGNADESARNKSFSFRSLRNFIEESFSMLADDPNSGKQLGQGAEGGRRHSTGGELRGSTPIRYAKGYGPERLYRASVLAQGVDGIVHSSDQQPNKSRRANAANSFSALSASTERRRRRSAPELYRRSSDSNIMPTLNEDEETFAAHDSIKEQ